jgi:two-component system, NtrC family, response regulator PilR
MKYRVALIDDDIECSESLKRALLAHGFDDNHPQIEWCVVNSTQHVYAHVVPFKPQVIILDLCLDEIRGVESGFEILRKLQDILDTARIIVLTGHGDMKYGIRALQSGAASFVQKPADIPLLQALLRDAFVQSELRSALKKLQEDKLKTSQNQLIGESIAMRTLREQVSFAAAVVQPVLLTGETGTGKGVCARFIHRHGSRFTGNFVRCQPYFGSSDLVSSELFGHRRGSFTGATENREGLLAVAHRGTLFLDEVDQLPLHTQVALLEVLQEKHYRPLGSDREVISQFRLICAMNRDVQQSIAEGRLREDFYHRIAHLRIEVPPLRDRLEDIPLLGNDILVKLQESEDIGAITLSPNAVEKLQTYHWPGNVRELHAVVENAAFRAQFARRYVIQAEDIDLAGSSTRRSLKVLHKSFHQQVEDFKRDLVQDAILRNQGNKAKAAQELGLDRGTLRRLLELKVESEEM